MCGSESKQSLCCAVADHLDLIRVQLRGIESLHCSLCCPEGFIATEHDAISAESFNG
jgi:hypothetical protein